ncbi:MAG: Hsp70 family protein, partial [Planctomycetia bacterium]|nr:Hsp70 family protein [Planctomycetia bacterium]
MSNTQTSPLQMLKNIKKPVYLALAGGIGCMVLALVAELFLLFFSSAPQEPQYVCLTIDISGSMDGNKLGDVKQAANIFIDKRGQDNYLALTVFGSYGNELVPFSQDKDKLHTEINRLQAWGGTNFEDAMRISSNSILAKGNSQRDVKEVSHNNSALLIFTDGENSMGDPRIAIQIANELRKRGVRIYAIATQDCDFLFLKHLTGNRDHVIATDDGRIEQAFEQAEKMISSQLMETSGSSVNPLIGLLRVCLWTFFLCLGIALGLVGMQNAFLEKKMFTVQQSLKLAFWAILAGCVAGGAGQLLFSLVYFESLQNSVVGKIAKESAKTDPDRVVDFVKRQMSNPDWTFDIDGESLRPELISSIILKRLAGDATKSGNHEVQDVVITCPAYFGDLERSRTRQAGELAGLNVVEVLDEPVAAAIYYGVNVPDAKGKNIIVYDLGGGTFDVTVVRIGSDPDKN